MCICVHLWLVFPSRLRDFAALFLKRVEPSKEGGGFEPPRLRMEPTALAPRRNRPTLPTLRAIQLSKIQSHEEGEGFEPPRPEGHARFRGGCLTVQPTLRGSFILIGRRRELNPHLLGAGQASFRWTTGPSPHVARRIRTFTFGLRKPALVRSSCRNTVPYFVPSYRRTFVPACRHAPSRDRTCISPRKRRRLCVELSVRRTSTGWGSNPQPAL